MLITFCIFLPNLIWQYVHHFPNLEFARNAALYKNTETTVRDFVTLHLLDANLMLIPLILAFIGSFRSATSAGQTTPTGNLQKL